MVRSKNENRRARAKKNRAVLQKSGRPRVLIFRSNRAISAQLLNASGKILGAARTTKKGPEAAAVVGKKILEIAAEKKISEFAFDRNGYKFHGGVRQICESLKKNEK